MSFSELQTVMFEAAQLVNQRPIGRHQPIQMMEVTFVQMISYLAELLLRCHRDHYWKSKGQIQAWLNPAHRSELLEKVDPWLFPRTNHMIEKAQGKEERQGRGHHFDSNYWCSSRWLEDRLRYWSPSQPRQQSSTGHCIIQEWCQGDTTKYTSVERTVHRLMVLALIDDEDWMLRSQTCTFSAVWSVLHHSHSEWTETELSYKSCMTRTLLGHHVRMKSFIFCWSM